MRLKGNEFCTSSITRKENDAVLFLVCSFMRHANSLLYAFSLVFYQVWIFFCISAGCLQTEIQKVASMNFFVICHFYTFEPTKMYSRILKNFNTSVVCIPARKYLLAYHFQTVHLGSEGKISFSWSIQIFREFGRKSEQISVFREISGKLWMTLRIF